MSLPLTRRIARAALLVAAGAAPLVGASGPSHAAGLPNSADLGRVGALDGASLGETLDTTSRKATLGAAETSSDTLDHTVRPAGRTLGTALHGEQTGPSDRPTGGKHAKKPAGKHGKHSEHGKSAAAPGKAGKPAGKHGKHAKAAQPAKGTKAGESGGKSGKSGKSVKNSDRTRSTTGSFAPSGGKGGQQASTPWIERFVHDLTTSDALTENQDVRKHERNTSNTKGNVAQNIGGVTTVAGDLVAGPLGG
ncbi:hypothetical protein [Streptomyces zingiberis]|uniref:Uncharacterized protein n=1 Tax=Streptomyces zingiberis TaxID=2053010 RepID=A0ABX1BTF3_9ACTN|nr:hypothetical protein [Streptomyces zingiberis]NJQ00992.1 hypothetical protein [Streptomyces zingiberis]